MSASVRLLREFKEIAKQAAKSRQGNTGPPAPSPSVDDDVEIILYPKSESDLFSWTAFIVGPPDSPFANARFQLKIQVPSSYPMTPPKITFVTKMCHPNVHFKTGEICLDILKDTWTPVWTLESACRAIIALLGNPAADSPLNCDAAHLIRCGDMRGYFSLCQMYTIDHAILLPAKKGS